VELSPPKFDLNLATVDLNTNDSGKAKESNYTKHIKSPLMNVLHEWENTENRAET